jgi:hypothetical protein
LHGQESDGNYYYIDLSGQASGIEDTADNIILGGDDPHDYVHAGAGADKVTLGNGNSDIIIGGIGSNQTFVEGAGIGDIANAGTGAGQTFTTNGLQATLSDNIAGDDNLLFKAFGGASTVNVGDNGSVETVKLGGTANNTINVGLEAGANSAGNNLTITGATGTDIFNFAGTNPTVTQISKTEVELTFSNGQLVDIHTTNAVGLSQIEAHWHFG